MIPLIRRFGEAVRGFPALAGEISDGASRLGWAVVGVLAPLLGVAVLASWIYSSYADIDVPASFGQVGNDGGCAHGLGVHCWSDFAATRYASMFAPPSIWEILYPPSARVLRVPFFAIDQWFGEQAGLITYSAVAILCLLGPIVWAVRHIPWTSKPVVLVVAGVATTPFLFAWDRGNVLILTVPFLFLATWAFVRDRPWLVAACVIVISMVKPQFVVVGFVLVAVRAWWPAVVAIVGSGLAIVLSFFLYGPAWWSELRGWVDNTLDFSARELSWDWPTNISLAHALRWLSEAGPWGALIDLPDAAYSRSAFVILGVVALIVLIVGRRLPRLLIATVFLAIPCIALGTSFGYYAVFVFPVFAILFRDGLRGWPARGALRATLVWSVVAALVASLTTLLLPAGPPLAPTPSIVVYGSAFPVLGVLAWCVHLIAIAVLAVRTRRAPEPLAPTADTSPVPAAAAS